MPGVQTRGLRSCGRVAQNLLERIDKVFQLLAFQLPCRQLQDNLLLLLDGCTDLHAVQHQKRFHCEVPDALIAIDEWMIHYQREAEG
jgi:hypothetical protein